jgi:hypothetical protein
VHEAIAQTGRAGDVPRELRLEHTDLAQLQKRRVI